MSSTVIDSLVKYDVPVLVTKKRQDKKKYSTKADKEDLLNQILPPIEYTEDGQLWVRNVSQTPATRADVISLQDDLDKKLQTR